MRTNHPIRTACLLALLTGAGANAAVINVPGDFPLSVAIAVAVSGDEIVIAPSPTAYQVFPGLQITNKALTIRGATGNPADVVIDGVGLDIVLRISGAGSDGTLLQALTIQNGRGGTANNASGAGVWINDADVTIRNCVIRNNILPAPDGNGAGVYATLSNIVIEGCVIEGNTIESVSADGVGAYFNAGSQTITDSVFRNNRVPAGAALELSSVGGGLYADVGSLRITRCRFEDNRAGFGGGVAVIGNMTSVTIDETVFADNEARNGGGFGANSTAGPLVPRIRNSLFVGNLVTGNDSAIYSDKGGFLTNLTLVDNISDGSFVVGGSSPTGSLILDNSIIWGNTYNLANGPLPSTTPDIVRRSILQQAYAGASGSGFNRVVDPMFVDASSRNYRLMPMSPAIDSGDTNLYFGPFADLLGAPRVVDIPGVADTGFSLSGPVIDVGAIEFQQDAPVITCPGDTNGDGVINFTDLNAVLSVFGTTCD